MMVIVAGGSTVACSAGRHDTPWTEWRFRVFAPASLNLKSIFRLSHISLYVYASSRGDMFAFLCSPTLYLITILLSFSESILFLALPCTFLRSVNHGALHSREDPVCWHCLTLFILVWNDIPPLLFFFFKWCFRATHLCASARGRNDELFPWLFWLLAFACSSTPGTCSLIFWYPWNTFQVSTSSWDTLCSCFCCFLLWAVRWSLQRSLMRPTIVAYWCRSSNCNLWSLAYYDRSLSEFLRSFHALSRYRWCIGDY